ncbi:hypothetical protein CBR_g48221 [Chara braunii]|uniref:DOMON domain-containing protein n=1 Tax=Chara braunii TaxID=69332 RepID=A0A388M2A9_CHABU|nr:hypothetical protein CBR_g48221 [Chara braunii]|eukprot:GBG88691.1 hypothetical protein CBR_g48221 [Chara braunii]
MSWLFGCVAGWGSRSGSGSGAGSGACTARSPLVGFSADLSMGLHQLRGRITILDDCTFKVENFDMLPGNQVFWWAAKGESVMEMLTGVVVSPAPLSRLYSNETFQVRLDNVSWEGISILGVWSRETATDYGHVKLQAVTDPTPQATVFPNMSSQEQSSTPAPGPQFERSPPSSGGDASLTWKDDRAHPSGGSFLRAVRKGAAQPTMFENCLELSAGKVRVRWTVNKDNSTVDFGLEAAVPRSMYIAFGFVDPAAAVEDDLMRKSDVAVAGYAADTLFVSDYFITDYKDCQWQKKPVVGICPDAALHGSNNRDRRSVVDNVQLLYGHHKDGILFARYQRPVVSPDKDFDHDIDLTSERSFVWAIGPLRPKEGKTPVTPVYPGRKSGVDYGFGNITLGKFNDNCVGPLNASFMYSSHIKTARRGVPLVVTSGPSKDYPNPPASDRSLFIDGVETPVLQVERGVEIMFSVEAGHDVPFYITPDPVGGKWNESELVLAGGPESSGVHTSPYAMTWTPDAHTPNPVYYQSLTGKKMGWLIEILERGLPDMYQSRAWLSNERVELFWTVENDSIALAAQAAQPCGYLAIGFGSGMVQSTVYVGWIENGSGNVQEYWIDGRTPSNIHPINEGLVAKKVSVDDNFFTMEFERKLRLPKSRNTIDTQFPVKMIWAIGDGWTSGELTQECQHKEMSSSVTLVDLQMGFSKPEQLQPVFAVHGFMMFLAWGVLLPGGVMAARYLKALETQSHPLDLTTFHAKCGITAISLAAWQPLNAWMRPRRPSAGEPPQTLRVVWQFVHMYSGRTALVLGGIALLSGLMALADREELDYVEDLRWALIGYFCLLLMVFVYYEYRLRQNRKRQRSVESRPYSWTQNTSKRQNVDEDDRVQLLQGRWDTMLHGQPDVHDGSRPGPSEIQIEALNR